MVREIWSTLAGLKKCLSREIISSFKGHRKKNFHCRVHHSAEIRCTVSVNVASPVVQSSRPVQRTMSVRLLYLFHICVGKILPTAFHYQKGPCVSTYTSGHFSKPTYKKELCVTKNVLFGNKGHIDLRDVLVSCSWSADHVVSKSCLYRNDKQCQNTITFRSHFSIIYYFYCVLACEDLHPTIRSQLRLDAPPNLFMGKIPLPFFLVVMLL